MKPNCRRVRAVRYKASSSRYIPAEDDTDILPNEITNAINITRPKIKLDEFNNSSVN